MSNPPTRSTPTIVELLHSLRAETRELHARAERAGVMGLLLAGRLDRARYGALLRHLHALYVALEAALDAQAADPRLAPLLEPAWRRSEALACDLRAWHEGRLPDDEALVPALREYVERLQSHARHQPVALAAHAYARYLGDLHGGQILGELVRRAYSTAAQGATRFYDFGGAERVRVLRERLRAALAGLPLTRAEHDVVVAEARWAFAQHVELFEQLAR